MGTNPAFSLEQKQRIVNEYVAAHANNMTRGEVCDKNKVHISTVVKWVREFGMADQLQSGNIKKKAAVAAPVATAAPVLSVKKARPRGAIKKKYSASMKLQVLDAWRSRHQSGKTITDVMREFGIPGNKNAVIYHWAKLEKKLQRKAALEQANGQGSPLVLQPHSNGNGGEGAFIDVDPATFPRRGRPAGSVNKSPEWAPQDIPEEVNLLVGRLMIENVHLKRFGRRH